MRTSKCRKNKEATMTLISSRKVRNNCNLQKTTQSTLLVSSKFKSTVIMLAHKSPVPSNPSTLPLIPILSRLTICLSRSVSFCSSWRKRGIPLRTTVMSVNKVSIVAFTDLG